MFINFDTPGSLFLIFLQARMVELCEKRRRRCEKIDRQQAERREEMLEQAREKARDHKERLTAIHQVFFQMS